MGTFYVGRGSSIPSVELPSEIALAEPGRGNSAAVDAATHPGRSRTDSHFSPRQALAHEAVALILEDQSPPYEGRRRSSMGSALWFDSPGELVAAGVDYFGPVGRKVRRRLRGFTKSDVADTTNVVWVDLDPTSTLATEDRPVLVAEGERQLMGMKELGLEPSVFIFSGRGCWSYWKLDRHIPQVEAEYLMRRLYAQFRSGGSEHDIGRIARMPGSINEKTGLEAFVVEANDIKWDPVDLGSLLPDVDAPVPPTPRDAVAFDHSLSPGGRLPVIELPPHLSEYASARPSKAERVAQALDGHRLEQAIVSHLVNAGYSDSQIALYFDHRRLPRHEEEKLKRGTYEWLARGIAKSRARLVPSRTPLVSIGNGTYSEEDGEEGYGPRQVGWSRRYWLILKEMPEGLRKLDLLEWVKERFEIQRSQARRDISWLVASGFVTHVSDEDDRRIKRVYRTDEGRSRVESWSKPGTPFVFLKGLPQPASSSSDNLDPGWTRERPSRAAPASRPGVSAVDEEEVRARAEVRRRQRSLVNDVYRIHIPGNRWTYFQPLLPIDEWPLVRLHLQLPVGVDDDNLLVFRSFVSPRDPALGGTEAQDLVEQRTLRDGGYEARDYRVFPAAELVESSVGFELASRYEGDVLVPNLGLIVQSDRNFGGRLRRYRKRIPGSVIGARKRGNGLGTAYEFFLAGDGVQVDWRFDLDAFLEHLADPVEMDAVVRDLPPSWWFVRENV